MNGCDSLFFFSTISSFAQGGEICQIFLPRLRENRSKVALWFRHSLVRCPPLPHSSFIPVPFRGYFNRSLLFSRSHPFCELLLADCPATRAAMHLSSAGVLPPICCCEDNNGRGQSDGPYRVSQDDLPLPVWLRCSEVSCE